MNASLILGLCGLVLLIFRMKHRQPKINVKVSEVSARSKSKPLVSIIVPARNEEHVLTDLLL
jgi:cellulose synthase/poly-beta-1,6-N-acetylglucosamine synthase-like glycosyltransferase